LPDPPESLDPDRLKKRRVASIHGLRPASRRGGDRFTTEGSGECLVAATSSGDHVPCLFPELLILVEPGSDDVL
jgi:hypothetical protein